MQQSQMTTQPMKMNNFESSMDNNGGQFLKLKLKMKPNSKGTGKSELHMEEDYTVMKRIRLQEMRAQSHEEQASPAVVSSPAAEPVSVSQPQTPVPDKVALPQGIPVPQQPQTSMVMPYPIAGVPTPMQGAPATPTIPQAVPMMLPMTTPEGATMAGGGQWVLFVPRSEGQQYPGMPQGIPAQGIPTQGIPTQGMPPQGIPVPMKLDSTVSEMSNRVSPLNQQSSPPLSQQHSVIPSPVPTTPPSETLSSPHLRLPSPQQQMSLSGGGFYMPQASSLQNSPTGLHMTPQDSPVHSGIPSPTGSIESPTLPEVPAPMAKVRKPRGRPRTRNIVKRSKETPVFYQNVLKMQGGVLTTVSEKISTQIEAENINSYVMEEVQFPRPHMRDPPPYNTLVSEGLIVPPPQVPSQGVLGTPPGIPMTWEQNPTPEMVPTTADPVSQEKLRKKQNLHDKVLKLYGKSLGLGSEQDSSPGLFSAAPQDGIGQYGEQDFDEDEQTEPLALVVKPKVSWPHHAHIKQEIDHF